MAFADWDDYRARLNAPTERITISKSSVTAVAGRIDSMWRTAPFGATVIPSTAVVPVRTTLGAIGQQNALGGLSRYITRVKAVNAGPRGTLILIDRLSQQGGLSGIVTTAQTTNLPTAALTRNTSGVDVKAALEFYTAVGTTATTASVTYTNQDGTGSRVSPLFPFGTTTYGGAADRFLDIPLALGDYGVRSVESVTVTATSGTAGNFGVVLYRQLLALPLMGPYTGDVVDYDMEAIIGLAGMLPMIPDDACLAWIFLGESTSNGVTDIEMYFSDV